jgi:hypothetical protein
MRSFYDRLYEEAEKIVNAPLTDEKEKRLEAIGKKIACFPDPEKRKYSQLLWVGVDRANRRGDNLLKETYENLVMLFCQAYAEPELGEVKEAYGDYPERNERKNNMG